MIEPRLATPRLLLRLARPGDAALIVDYFERNRAHLGPFEPSRPPGFYTPGFWAEQAVQLRAEHGAGRGTRFFLFDPEEITVLGTANLTGLQRHPFHACYLGYGVDHAHQGQGLMTEALEVVLDYAFRELRLHRVMANYMPHNRRSGELLRRLGFVVEGYARDYLRIQGRWEDHVLTSRTDPGWSPAER